MADQLDPERRKFLAGMAGTALLCAGGISTGLMLAPDHLYAANVLGNEALLNQHDPTTGTIIKSVSRYKQRVTAMASPGGMQTYYFGKQQPDLNIPAQQPPAQQNLPPSLDPAPARRNAGLYNGIQPGFHMGSNIPRNGQVVVNLPKTRGLWAYNPNVGEQIRVPYVRDGYYDPGALTAIDWLLRDHHFARYVPMSRRLYDVLYVTQYRYGFNKPLVITSGYRTPRTNQLLAERVPGVGRRSYHLRGQAVDFHVPGVPLRDLANFLLALGVGGVGLYPRHVHVDVGPLRSWA